MLRRFLRWLVGFDASQTQSGRRADYVTREELSAALEEYARESEYALNEWYEKFNTLHLRLSKRVKREESRTPPQLPLVATPPSGERPSVLHLRKLGSV